MTQRMYGVVLWADSTDQKAVIWCEDHGDLAYYHDTGVSAHDGVSLDAGDLIEFDMTQEQNLRFARNPERVVQQQYAGIAQKLRNADPVPPRHVAERGPMGQVLQFRMPEAQKNRAVKQALRA